MVLLLRRSLQRLWSRAAAAGGSVRPLSYRTTVREAVECKTAENVTVLGWVKNVRKQKKVVFIDINDGSTAKKLQVVAPSDLLEGVPVCVGCSVVAEGKMVERPLSGTPPVEMAASSVTLLGTCNTKEYPFKRGEVHGMEYLRRFPHLRPKTGVFSCLLRLRNAATMAVHRFFQDRGFFNVHTPIITSSDCEGAGELFEIRPAQTVGERELFFSTQTFLTVSGQLHAEAVASGMDSVYTFGPTFRAEKSHTKRHLSEFYMIEAETTLLNSGLQELLCLVEELYKQTLQTLLTEACEDMHYFHSNICSPDTKTSILNSLEKPFVRITYTEAMGVLERASCKDCFNTQPKWGDDLQREHELYLLSEAGEVPVFVTEFPAHIKPFYTRTPESNSDIALSVDLLVPGVGEVVGGSVREEREDILRDRLIKLGLLHNYQWYLDLRRFGTVPHGGFGVGFERLLQAYLGVADIRDVIPFPRYLGSCQM